MAVKRKQLKPWLTRISAEEPVTGSRMGSVCGAIVGSRQTRCLPHLEVRLLLHEGHEDDGYEHSNHGTDCEAAREVAEGELGQIVEQPEGRKQRADEQQHADGAFAEKLRLCVGSQRQK